MDEIGKSDIIAAMMAMRRTGNVVRVAKNKQEQREDYSIGEIALTKIKNALHVNIKGVWVKTDPQPIYEIFVKWIEHDSKLSIQQYLAECVQLDKYNEAIDYFQKRKIEDE